MKDSGWIIEGKAACGHEVRVTTKNLVDFLEAAIFDRSYVEDDIKEAIKKKNCPECVRKQAKRDT